MARPRGHTFPAARGGPGRRRRHELRCVRACAGQAGGLLDADHVRDRPGHGRGTVQRRRVVARSHERQAALPERVERAAVRLRRSGRRRSRRTGQLVRRRAARTSSGRSTTTGCGSRSSASIRRAEEPGDAPAPGSRRGGAAAPATRSSPCPNSPRAPPFCLCSRRVIAFAAVTGPAYVLACVAVPCGIGLLMYVAFELWNRRRKKSRGALPVIDYMI